MPAKKIRVIMHGGTIDAESYQHTPDFKLDRLPPKYITPRATSLIPAYLKSKGYGECCEFTQLEMKDSQKFTEKDMNDLIAFIQEAEEPVIVISFGTDGMADTARRMLARHTNELPGKTIIFTGAMEPLAHRERSDGRENIEFAVRAGRDGELKPSVYAAVPNWEWTPHVFIVDEEFKKIKEQVLDGRKVRPYFTGNTLNVQLPPPSSFLSV